MRFLYLRFVIGGLCAACVAVVAALTLSVALPIALSTIDTNSVAAVTSLGGTAAAVIERSFATPKKSVVEAANRPRASEIETALPTEHPDYNSATGAPAVQQLRRIVYTMAQSGDFNYFLVEYATIDGMTCLGFKVDVINSYAIRCYHPNATGQRVMTVTVHDRPSGQINHTLHGFILAAFRKVNIATSPNLADASYREFWDSRLIGGPAGSAVWAKPVLITDTKDDFVSISVASRIRNVTSVLGVTNIFFTLDGVSSSLDGARLTANSKAFLYDADQYLVAASGGLATYVSDDFTGIDEENGCTTTQNSTFFFPSPRKRRVCRYHIMRSPHAGLTKAVEKEPSLFDHAPTKGQGHLVADQYVFVQALQTVEYGYHLDLVLITPEEDIIGDAKKILPIALGVTAAAVLIAATAAFVLVWLVLSPLQGVAVRMGKAARLEEDDADERLSMMAEIHDLQQSFVMLRDELTRIRAFVPQSLLRAHSATDTGTDEEAGDRNTDADAAPQRSCNASDRSLTTIATVTSGASATCAGPSRRLEGSFRSPADQAAVSPTLEIAKKDRWATRPSVRRLNVDTCIKKENVTVLVVNLCGYHAAVGPGVDADAVAAMVDAVLGVTQQEKGVVDSFHGDRFFISFNAVRHAAGHSIRAAKVACRIRAVLREQRSCHPLTAPSSPLLQGSLGDREQLRRADPGAVIYNLPITAGISTGHAQVGNLGSAAIKRFSIVGPVVAQAAVLERMCKLHDGVHCLVPQRLFDDLQTAVRLRTVDFVQLPGRFPGKCQGQLVANVESELTNSGDDEWMYQLAEHQVAADDDIQVPLNKIWDLLARGHVREASNLFGAAVPEAERGNLCGAVWDKPRSAQEALWSVLSIAEDRAVTSNSPAVIPTSLGPFYDGSIGAWTPTRDAVNPTPS